MIVSFFFGLAEVVVSWFTVPVLNCLLTVLMKLLGASVMVQLNGDDYWRCDVFM